MIDAMKITSVYPHIATAQPRCARQRAQAMSAGIATCRLGKAEMPATALRGPNWYARQSSSWTVVATSGSP